MAPSGFRAPPTPSVNDTSMRSNPTGFLVIGSLAKDDQYIGHEVTRVVVMFFFSVILFLVFRYFRNRLLMFSRSAVKRERKSSLGHVRGIQFHELAAQSVELTNFTLRDRGPKLVGVPTNEPTLSTKEKLGKLRKHLPADLRLRDWRLQFSTARDGYSLSNLYRKLAGNEQSIILVQDRLGNIFGGFNSCAWKSKFHRGGDSSASYYGTGETFVFKMAPEFEVYPWTGRNDQFVLCDKAYLAFGGGGSFALHLDKNLRAGSSERSETFGNMCLASCARFEISALEVWTFENW